MSGFYDSKENVEQYIQMAEGYDGRFLIEKLQKYLPHGSSLLEIGMGPGTDMDLLKDLYKVTGSDNSEFFLKRYRDLNPHADLLLLDGVTLETDKKFDALYSNKVLHHLCYEEMKLSFNRQADLLNPGGILLHSFWYGTEVEEYEGLMFYQITEEKLKSLVGTKFEILDLDRYTEMEENDSLYGILRKY